MSKDLVTNNIWGIVIDDNGNVVWKHNLPKEIPLNYSLQDVATFSKGYIENYPVFTWKQGNDLLVLGYPKNSYSKFMTNYLPLFSNTENTLSFFDYVSIKYCHSIYCVLLIKTKCDVKNFPYTQWNR